MIAEFTDSVSGAAIYINPRFVISFRPDPEDPLNGTLLKLQDGESIRVRGDHREVADKLAEAARTAAV